MKTNEFRKRLDRLDQGRPRFKVVIAPEGFDPKDWHRIEHKSDPDVVVLAYEDRDL